MKRPRPRLIAAAAMAIVLAGSLAACSDSSSTTAGSSSDKRSLTLALNAIPPSFDPAKVDGGSSSQIWASLYDTLLYVGGDGIVKPNAAEKWSYSADAKTLTLQLRSGMTFSNGDPVTADDVVATIERTQKTPGTVQGAAQDLKSITASGDRTVVINLTRPDPSLLIDLASGLGIIGDAKTLTAARTATDPIGSGPYVLDAQKTQQGTTYVLTRRKGYWNAAAYAYANVTFKVITDTTAVVNALQSGEIDGATVQPSQVAQVKGAGFTTKQVPVGVALLALTDREGTVLPQLADVRVRRAINMAFDRKAYVSKLLQGYGAPTEQVFNPNAGAAVPKLNDVYSYDPAGAKKLLAEAGYPNGFAISLPSTFLSTNYEPTISQSLKDIGVSVKWVTIPDSQINSVLSSKKYPIAFWEDGYNQPSRETFNEFNSGGYLNPFGATDTTMTALLDEAASTTDPTAANAVYQKINEYAVQNALTCPLFTLTNIWASKTVRFVPDGPPAVYTLRDYAAAAK